MNVDMGHIMVSPGHSGERTEVRLVEGSRVVAIRYVVAELTTEDGRRELAAARAELKALDENPS
jgi:hypothetical protein